MKTTIEIADSLLQEARCFADREGLTLSALVERGLRRVLSESRQETAFKLRRASFKGQGLNPELRDAAWGHVRALIYQNHAA